MSTEERKLAAIVFTDICGFTELMGRDETKAMSLLDQQRALLKPIISNFNGEWLKEIGDGVLISFPSAVKAVTCSLEIQRILAHNSDLTLRIGIHIGDVIKKGGDVFGDGVNIASRLEPLAEPGGICVSERVHEDIKNKPEISTAFQEEQLLKGVDKPIKVYSIFTQMGTAPMESPKSSVIKKSSGMNFGLMAGIGALVLAGVLIFNRNTTLAQPKDERKSIAVLPFDNYSTAEKDQYFSDGLTEVIIANLTKIRDLKVISRTSVMQYKNTTKSMKEIGKELNVATILEGSIQRGGDRIRIVGQLIDTKTDEHIWAETYDSKATDLFDIQIDVAHKIAEVLKVKLTSNEKTKLSKKPTENLEAWDYYLKGLEFQKKSYSKEDSELAIYFYEKATELDPNFDEAFAKLAELHMWMSWGGYDRTEKRKILAKDALDKAMKIDSENPDVRVARGYYYYHGYRDYLRALEDFKYAQTQAPGNGSYNEHVAYIERRLGRFNNAIANLQTAFEFDPKNPMISSEIASTYADIYDYEKAIQYSEKAILLAPDVVDNYSMVALANLWKGDFDKAMTIVNDGLKIFKSDYLHLRKAHFTRLDRDYQSSLESLESIIMKIDIAQTKYKPIETRLGQIYHLIGNQKLANQYFTKSRSILEIASNDMSNDARIFADYGLVLAYLGEKQEAVKAGKMAVSLISIEKDAIIGAMHFHTFTKILCIVGEYNKAIENLILLRSIPAGIHLEELKRDPVWDPLRDHPRFEALLIDQKEKA
jgi:TolB-like protein/Tfp pilus assembly protein PilF